MRINGKFNENKTKMNSYLIHQSKDKNVQELERYRKLGF